MKYSMTSSTATRAMTLLATAFAAVASAPSAWAVLHGQQIAESDFPAVKKISIHDNGICTGTFIRPGTLLTAGHCAVDALVQGWASKRLDLTVDGKAPVGYRIHPRYENHAVDMQAYDVALIQFPADANASVLSLSTRAARAGDAVTIVGYGVVNGFAGVKRAGRNSITDTMMGQILLTGRTGDDSIAESTPGDSGGPLLNDRGELVGVTSRASNPGMVLGGEATSMSSYIDLSEPAIRQFVEESAKTLQSAPATSGRRGD